jgi:hypothetical protein
VFLWYESLDRVGDFLIAMGLCNRAFHTHSCTPVPVALDRHNNRIHLDSTISKEL